MKVIIKETKATRTFELIDPKSGVNYVTDFIGNAGGFVNGDFSWNEEQGAYVCNQDSYDWWEKVIADNQALDHRISELSEKHGNDAVSDVVLAAATTDLEDHAGAVNFALDEAFGQ